MSEMQVNIFLTSKLWPDTYSPHLDLSKVEPNVKSLTKR